MRTKILVGCAAIILGVIGMSGQAQKPAAATTVTSAAAEKTFFTQYCYGCHNQAAKARGVESALRITLEASIRPTSKKIRNTGKKWFASFAPA